MPTVSTSAMRASETLRNRWLRILAGAYRVTDKERFRADRQAFAIDQLQRPLGCVDWAEDCYVSQQVYTHDRYFGELSSVWKYCAHPVVWPDDVSVRHKVSTFD